MTHGFSEIKVEFAEGNQPFIDSTLTWTDRTAKVRAVSIDRGRDTMLDHYQPGTATLVLKNQDGTFSPGTNANIIPNLPVRVSATNASGTRRNLYTGFVKPRDGWSYDYLPGVKTATASCVDALGVLASVPLPRLDPPAYGGNLTGSAMVLIGLAYAPLLPAWQSASIDNGYSIIGDIELGTDALSVFQDLADADGGSFYIDRDGNVTFDDRYALLTDSRQSTSQVTFDNSGASGVSYSVNQFQMSYATGIYNAASVTPVGGTAETYTDTTSQNAYGPVGYPATNSEVSSQGEAQSRARFIVNTNKTPFWSPQSLVIDPRRYDTAVETATLNAAVERELHDRVTVWYRPENNSSAYDLFVERIRHDIDLVHGTWKCGLSFSDRRRYTNSYDIDNFLILDDATKGKFDTGKWGY